MNITVVGTGYVGLVTGACFAEMGHKVTCIDTDTEKIDRLNKGHLPIKEPGLDEIVLRNQEEDRLFFSTTLAEALAKTQVCFIAVGTPLGEDGSADLSSVLAVAREIGHCLHDYLVVVNKSTVPVGTADKVRAVIAEELAAREVEVKFEVVSNPEFLKQGAAVNDFMRPDRIVIGTGSLRAGEIMRSLYTDFSFNTDRILMMDIKDAEMSKYVSNALLATKISFMNEIAGLCDKIGVDVEKVRVAVGADHRIGHSFLYPGCGYGGSCFPKDVQALAHMARGANLSPMILQAIHERNEEQKHILFQKIKDVFGADLSGLIFSLWGLSFKPGTDDMREAPSVTLLHELIGAGARVKAYDPVAMDVARRELPRDWFDSGKIELMRHQYETLEGADAMVLVTEWKPFRHPDFSAMKGMMKRALVFDGRNQYDPKTIKEAGFEYYGIGRG